MGVSIAVAAIGITTLLALSFSEGQSQSFTCYTADSCSGASFTTSDSTTCCFGTGYSYNDGSSCQDCFVIGWKNASMPDGSINTTMTLRLVERSLSYKFEVGCLKGNNINFAIFTVGPATETSDYDITPHAISLVNCSEVFIVDLFLKVDNRAMEQDETISLTLTQTPDSSYNGVFVINITIIDSDVVQLRFNEDDYSETENEAFDVVVRQLEPRKDLDSEIVLRLIPVNYTYANESGFYTGEEIPFDPNVPNRAVGGVDYNDTIIKCIFPAGDSMPQVSNRVEIIDDTIDEDRQFFFILLEVESATNKDRVKLTNKITKCNINDNDDTYLSFEYPSYFVSERGTMNFPINIIKQEKNATATENVYDLTISIKSRSAMLTNEDLVAAKEAKRNIKPHQSKVDPAYFFTINDDGINEANESFVLSISPVTNEVQWSAGDYITTTITIIDDDETPVFGFVNPNVTVSEDIGMYFQKVTTYVPDPNRELAGQFNFLLTSVDISASNGVDYTSSDIGLFGAFHDNNRDKSARISIIDDSRLEEDEVFYLSLRHFPGRPVLSEFNLTVATFIIVDNDYARVGLERTAYIVNENTGVVEICARVFEPSIPCPIDFAFNLTIDTIDGTAVNITDYMGVSTALMFKRCAIRSCVSIFIVNDTMPEDEEYFTVVIGRSSSLHPNITLTATEANISISDDDPIVVGYEPTVYTTTEGQGSVVLVAVVLFPKTGAPRPFTIVASTSNGTAGGDLDYKPVTTMRKLEFSIGDTRKSHTIMINDDEVCERTPNEHFFSDLFQVSPLVTIDPMRATVLINDFNETECDPIIVGYDKTVYTTTEGQESVVLVVVVMSPETGASRPFTIAASTSHGTAGGFDYNAIVMQPLVFEIGDKNQSHTIPIRNDSVCESNPNEQFFSNLVYVSGLRPIMIDPMRATATVIIDDSNEPECDVIIGFVRVPSTVPESVGMAVVTIGITSGVLSGREVTVQIFTMDGSANSGTDYTETVQNITFVDGPVKNENISILITNDNIEESDENFKVGLSLISPVRNVLVNQTMPSIQIIDDDKPTVSVNDTLTGDPLLTVPILTDTVNNIQTSLCYEIHGKADTFFNLISDSWVSVNANYTKAVAIGGSSSTVPDVNVVNSIGVRALSSKGCHNIGVDLNGCQATVDNIIVSTTTKLNGISIRKFNNRVRIAIPKPKSGQSTLVMWIFCMDGSIGDFHFHMMRLLVTRGVGLDITSHGLIGQFWNVPVSVTAYDGNFAGSQRSDDYLIRVPYPRSRERSFVGILGDKTWEFEKRPCLYVGNSQGGPIDEVDKDGPNDSVIEGEYTQYEVAGLFSTLFTYGRFNEGSCIVVN